MQQQSIKKSMVGIGALVLVLADRYMDRIVYCGLWLASVYIFAHVLTAIQSGRF